MTDTIFGAIIGGLVTFISTILLFFLTKYFESVFKKHRLLKYFKKEFEFNLRLVKLFINECDRIKGLLSNNATGIPFSFSLSKYQNNLFLKCLTEGYLYDIFSNEELSYLCGDLQYFTIENEKLFNEIMQRMTGKNELLDFFHNRQNELVDKYNRLINLQKQIHK